MHRLQSGRRRNRRVESGSWSEYGHEGAAHPCTRFPKQGITAGCKVRTLPVLDSMRGRSYYLAMPYAFREWEYEPETQSASARGGGPPKNVVGVDVLDPLLPPAKPSGTGSLSMRILAAALLAALLGGLLSLWLHR